MTKEDFVRALAALLDGGTGAHGCGLPDDIASTEVIPPGPMDHRNDFAVGVAMFDGSRFLLNIEAVDEGARL